MKHYYLGKQHALLDLIFKLESDPEDGKDMVLEEQSYVQIADHYELLHLIDKALHIVDHGLRYYSLSSDLKARKAHLLLQYSQEDEALKLLSTTDTSGTTFINTELLRARVLIQKKAFEQALHILYNLKCEPSIQDRELSKIYFYESTIFEHREEYECMYIALRESLLLDVNNREAMESLFFCLDMVSHPRESIDLCWQLIDKNPYSFLAWYNLGHAYYGTFEYKKAVEAFEYSFIINENFAPAYFDCAEVSMHIRNYKKAMDCYQELLQFDEPDGFLLYKMGVCYEYLGQFQKARTILFRALSRHPKNDEVQFHLGECFAKEMNWTSAAYHYQAAIKIDQEREDYQSALADVYIRMGRFKKAEPLLLKAARLLPELSEKWMQAARFYIIYGQATKGLEILREGEIDAYGADILYGRAACLYHLGQHKASITVLGQGLTEDFDSHYLFFELAPKARTDSKVLAAIRYFRYE